MKNYVIFGLAIALVLAIIGWVESSGAPTDLELRLAACGQTSEEDQETCEAAEDELRDLVNKYGEALSPQQ